MKYLLKTFLPVFALILGLQSVMIAQESKPNVLFIMCDDLNDYQGVFGGHPQAITPNIDRLAASGVQFVNAQSNIPVCQPSRNSLFTGVYPHDSKDFGWTPMKKQPVLKNNKTIMKLFQENGYKILGTGKLTHGKPSKVWDAWGMQHNHNYGPFYFDGENRIAHSEVPAPFNGIGPVDGSFGRLSTAKVDSISGWVYGWDKKPMRYVNDDDRDLMQDELHARWAVKQIKAMEASEEKQPFFLGVGFVRPHTPLHAPDKYFDMYPLDELELAPWLADDTNDIHWLENFDANKKGAKYYRMLLESFDGDRELAMKTFLQAYLACVTFVDEQIGLVLDALENSEFNANTIVVLTSDHGWQMGEKDYLFKNSPWEESARIPLVIRAPKTQTGEVEQPVSLIDVYPTLVDLCNLQGSNKLNETGADLGGFSLKTFLENPNSKEWEGPKGALTIVGNYGNQIPLGKQNFSYRTKEWRYIRYSNGKEELYNHLDDPNEWTNIASLKKYKKVKKQLISEMNEIVGLK